MRCISSSSLSPASMSPWPPDRSRFCWLAVSWALILQVQHSHAEHPFRFLLLIMKLGKPKIGLGAFPQQCWVQTQSGFFPAKHIWSILATRTQMVRRSAIRVNSPWSTTFTAENIGNKTWVCTSALRHAFPWQGRADAPLASLSSLSNPVLLFPNVFFSHTFQSLLASE